MNPIRTLLLAAAACLAASPLQGSPSQEGQDAPAARRARDGVRNVAIFVFQGVELLDFAGPGEVFAAARGAGGRLFHVYTVGVSRAPITSQGFVSITPEYTLTDCPPPDLVVIPGGGVPLGDARVRDWIAAHGETSEIVLTVCNGALLAANAGLLRDAEATTHHGSLLALARREPTARVYTNRRFVDNGRVITSAGVSAGIDGALHVLERLHGTDAAWATARYMEYDWEPDEIARLHAQPGIPPGRAAAELAQVVRTEGLERALERFRELVATGGSEAPSERRLNEYGYGLLGSGSIEEAIALFRLNVAAHPASANTYDSLSEAYEVRGDREAALRFAREALARAGADEAAVLRASRERIERLEAGANDSYACPPCGGDCDSARFAQPGACPSCGMWMRAVVSEAGAGQGQ